MKMLRGVKRGAEDWQEEIITTDEAAIPAATQWAKEHGYDRFRVAEYTDGERPDFTKVVGGK